ncbi:MAG TPA: right-handed parallel beta-helix repeat-containing protein [Candidatus Omnitrophota bacterium]|nr:right-handed parallel beta-helix repeat-containing protein [Candidatus Omnitrophota bacterium]
MATLDSQKRKWQKSCNTNNTKNNRNHKLPQKAVAIIVTAFFIFQGIPVPTSVAAIATLTQNERQELVPVVKFDANQTTNTTAPKLQTQIPSGFEFQNPNPLSVSSASTTPLQQDGNPSLAFVPAQEKDNVLDANSVAKFSIIRVRAGESIQTAINQAQAGDVVLLDAGIYLQSLVLKPGVNLQGENRETTIISGQGRYEDIIVASGNNRIGNLTITGGVAYQGTPFSAIRVEGDNVIISGTNIRNNANYGIYLRSGQNALIEYNLFLNNNLSIQHPLTSASGAVIKNNTIVNSRIGINLLNGVKPVVRNNIITGSTYASIYEFCWGQTPSRGFAAVEGNIFFNNTEKGSYYGSALPPSVETRIQGNIIADPKFVNAAQGNYRLQPGSPALGKGAYPDPIALAGWTYVPSNTKYAYQYGFSNPQDPMTGTTTLKVQNLVTGHIYIVDVVQTRQNDFWGYPVITPDETKIIYLERVAGGGINVCIQALQEGALKQYVFINASPANRPDVIQMSGNEVLVDTANPAWTYHIDLTTVKLVPAPFLDVFGSGTTMPVVSQSSPMEFSINYNVVPVGSFSGAVINFASLSGGSKDISNWSAVSFDMKTTAACSGTARCLKFELKDATGHSAFFWMSGLASTYSTRSISISMIRQFFPALDLTHIVQMAFIFENANLPNKTGRVDIRTTGGLYLMPPLPAGWTRAASNANYAFKVDGGTITLKDLTTNKDYWVWAFEKAGSFDVSPDGQQIIYDGYGRTTSPIPPTDVIYIQSLPALLSGGGITRTSITGEKIEALKFVTAQDGKKIAVIVTAMHVYEYETATGFWKATWTLATSNKNYAFQSLYERVGGYSRYTLQLMNLVTGQVQNIATRMDPYGGYTGVYDVSPDGSTVIYDIEGPLYPTPVPHTTYLQRISDPAAKLALNGIALQSITYESAGKIAVINGTIRVDLATLQRLFLSISGTTYNPSLITQLANQPILNSGSGSVDGIANGTITLTQTSPRDFSFNYNLADADDFVFAYLSNGYFTDDTHFNGQTVNLSAGLTLAAQGALGQQLKVEIKDVNGQQAVVYLALNGTKQNYTINLTGLGIDATRVAQVAFIADRSHMQATGQVNVEVNGMYYIPVIIGVPGTAVPSSYSFPSLTVFSNPAGAANLVQYDADRFRLNYNLSQAGSYAGSISSFDNFGTAGVESYDLSTATTLIAGLRFASGSGSVYVEFEDASGHRAKVIATDITTTEKFVQIPIGALRTLFTSFDFSHVKNINFILETHKVTNKIGALEVRFGKYPYTPVVNGSVYNQSLITQLPNVPVLSSGSGAVGTATANGTIAVTQTSSRNFAMNYTLADSDDFVFSSAGNGYFNNNVWIGTAMNLSSGLVLAANGPAGKQLKVEVKDTTGRVAVYYLNLSGTTQNYALNFAGMGIDATRVAQILFVADRAHMGASGQVAVETKGLAYVPLVPPTTAPLTDFSGLRPSVSEIEPSPANTVTSLTQSSSSQFSLNYNLTNGGSQRWAAGMLLFSPGAYFNAAAAPIVLDVNVTGARYYKVEVEDANGRKVTVRVNLTNGRIAISNAVLQSVGIAGFDATQIKAIILVVDDPSATTGTLTVNTRGLYYEPTVTTDPTLGISNISTLPGIRSVTAIEGGGAGQSSVFQSSSSVSALQYNVTTAGSWSLLLSSFDDFGTPAVEAADLRSISSIVVGLKLSAGTGRIKFQVEDANGGRAMIYLLNVGITEQFYRIPINALTGVDLAHVKNVNFVVENNNISLKTGQLQVRLGGYPYIPVISWTTTAPLTDFIALQPSVSPIEAVAHTTVASFVQPSANQFVMDFNLAAGGNQRWAAAMMLFSPGAYFNAAAAPIVLDVNVTGARYYKVEVEDANGRKVTVRVNLTNGRIAISNAVLQSVGIAGFDATQIKAIILVVDDPSATVGRMIVNTRGLYYVPLE